MPGGHAPWLADAQHAAELIATHSHLAPQPASHPDTGRKPASKRAGLTGNNKRSPSTRY